MRAMCMRAAAAWLLAGGLASAQDQTIIVDRPLDACATALPVTSATLSEEQAAAVIRAALRINDPDPNAYYIIHATEFVPGRPTVAEENWYVYHTGWTNRTTLNWFTDARRAKRFTEARIMGSARVGLVYLYVNVPAFETTSARSRIADHFRRQHTATPLDDEARRRLIERLKGGLPPEAEQRAASEAAKAPRGATPGADAELVVQLETERYLRAFGDGDKAISDEISLVNEDTGEALVGLSPTLATAGTFGPLNTLFYKVGVTKKTPAPVDNFKNAVRLAFAGQADGQTLLYVPVRNASVCAGADMHVKHVPSDMIVTALSRNAKDEEVQRSKQQFDNEGRYWWDVSFALPMETHEDLTIDVDGGQIAAKKVEKTELFATVNLGLPRDTKRLQWQLIPSFLYGLPITGKPLKHHLVGFSFGLNYVQLFVAHRFDRVTEVSTEVVGNTPVGVEASPAEGEKWTGKWVWGVNIPVQTVVKLFSKDGKK
jgi:hypothetical protein